MLRHPACNSLGKAEGSLFALTDRQIELGEFIRSLMIAKAMRLIE